MKVLFFLGVFFSLFSCLQKVTPQSHAADTTSLTAKIPVLLITLTVNRETKSLDITSLTKALGFVPDYTAPATADYLSITITSPDQTQQLLTIPLPLTETYAPPPAGITTAYPKGERKIDQVTYTLILPYQPESIIKLAKNFYQENSLPKTETLAITLPKTNSDQAILSHLNLRQEISIRDSSQQATALANEFTLETIYDGNPSLTNPADTLDIIFVASGFTNQDMTEFRNFSTRQAAALFGLDGFPGKNPFSTNKRLVKIRRLVSTRIFHHTSGTYTNADIPEVINILGTLGIPYDQIAVVLNADGRSYASLSGDYCVLFKSWGGPERNLLFAHEIAHSFGGVLDEYTEQSGSTDLWDIGKNCKEDPDQPWINNLPGGAYRGCNLYWNLYRPEPDSLMIHIGDDLEFNAPSKYLLSTAFANYVNHIPTIFLPSVIKQSFDIGDYPWPQVYLEHAISTASTSREPFSYQASFNPSVDWIASTNLTGSSGTAIRFGLIGDRLTSRGTYQTNLVVTFNLSPPVTKTIPIVIQIGKRTDGNNISLNLASPTNNLHIPWQSATPINLAIASTIAPPGWKRIEYHFYDPFFDNGMEQNIGAKTISPYSLTWDIYAQMAGDPTWRPVGTYQVWAKGYPHFGTNPIESAKTNIEVVAPPGTVCLTISPQATCQSTSLTNKCFRGSSDCQKQGKPYCCPPYPYYPPVSSVTPIRNLTPSPTLSPTLTPSPTITPPASPTPPSCPSADKGNLNCDSAGLISEIDLSLLLSTWSPTHRIPTPKPTEVSPDLNGDGFVSEIDLSILLANWKTS